MKEHTVFFSLGSNLGDREENINQAIEMIDEQIGTVMRQSALYYSAPWGYDSVNEFANSCISCRTTLSPGKILKLTQAIERSLGRNRKTDIHNPEYHDRTIDIDILLYDDERIETAELTIPHPYMYERDFVMVPLREILDEE